MCMLNKIYYKNSMHTPPNFLLCTSSACVMIYRHAVKVCRYALKREVAAFMRGISAEYVRFKTGRHHNGHAVTIRARLCAVISRIVCKIKQSGF